MLRFQKYYWFNFSFLALQFKIFTIAACEHGGKFFINQYDDSILPPAVGIMDKFHNHCALSAPIVLIIVGAIVINVIVIAVVVHLIKIALKATTEKEKPRENV